MLELLSVSKSFDEHTVLDGCSQTIDAGSLTAIIGPNGCGKSTLFNLISGDLAIDSGQIHFQNEVINSPKKSLPPKTIAQKGLLRKFQIPGIYPDLTVEAHFQLASILSKKNYNLTWYAWLMAPENQTLVGFAQPASFSAVWQKPAKYLSTGQKQWLELAMLLQLQPKLLLLDEPIAGLAYKESKQMRYLLQQLNAHGLSIIVIEHNMHFVQSLTEDILVLLKGRFHLRGNYQMIKQDDQVRAQYLGSLYA